MPRLSDPRRLPRRNHYQEGPGFLFVATQGGRPPSGGAGERHADVVRRRRAAVRRLEFGETASVICAEVGCTCHPWPERRRSSTNSSRSTDCLICTVELH